MTSSGSMRGVALAQLLVALSLCGVVSAVVAGWHEASVQCSARDRARALVASSTRAVFEWQERHPGEGCPRTLEEALRGGVAGASPRDPWGEPLVYRCPGTVSVDGFDLLSKGPDRRAGTSDDIPGWE